MNIEATVLNFISGSEKQKLWANSLRDRYVLELLENGVPEKEIKLLVIARPTAKWWIDNRQKLTLENAPSIIRYSKIAVAKAGSAEEYLDQQIIAEATKQKKLEDYRQAEEKEETLWQEESYLEELFEDRERPW